MRTTLTTALITILFVSNSPAETSLLPLISSDQPVVEISAPLFDRSTARELARFVAPAATEVQLLPNLRQVASVEILANPVLIARSPEPGTPQLIGKIVVSGASTVRFMVTGGTPGSVLWLAGERDHEFERFEPSSSSTWTPTTNGEVVYIASEGRSEGLTIHQMAVGTPQSNSTGTACAIDAACVSADQDSELTDASRAIALIRFVRGNASYVCTGGLINDRKGSGTPYFLTAHHCISTPEEAASIEAVWDDRSASCGSTETSSTRTRTYGAKLMVSSAMTDVALLRLNRLPSNRVFLGVELTALTEGSMTYRLSHADGATQKYSAGVVQVSGTECAMASRLNFSYSKNVSGAVSMGSSGAPLLVRGLRIAGQLLGLCGASPSDPCASYNAVVDGSIKASWPLLSAFLDPQTKPRARAAHL